jgi:site-specific recombinase XerD
MRGESMKIVAELLGHSTITITNRYAHLAPGAMRAAVAKLDEPAPSWTCSTVAANG